MCNRRINNQIKQFILTGISSMFLMCLATSCNDDREYISNTLDKIYDKFSELNIHLDKNLIFLRKKLEPLNQNSISNKSIYAETLRKVKSNMKNNICIINDKEKKILINNLLEEDFPSYKDDSEQEFVSSYSYKYSFDKSEFRRPKEKCNTIFYIKKNALKGFYQNNSWYTIFGYRCLFLPSHQSRKAPKQIAKEINNFFYSAIKYNIYHNKNFKYLINNLNGDVILKTEGVFPIRHFQRFFSNARSAHLEWKKYLPEMGYEFCSNFIDYIGSVPKNNVSILDYISISNTGILIPAEDFQNN